MIFPQATINRTPHRSTTRQTGAAPLYTFQLQPLALALMCSVPLSSCMNITVQRKENYLVNVRDGVILSARTYVGIKIKYVRNNYKLCPASDMTSKLHVVVRNRCTTTMSWCHYQRRHTEFVKCTTFKSPKRRLTNQFVGPCQISKHTSSLGIQGWLKRPTRARSFAESAISSNIAAWQNSWNAQCTVFVCKWRQN